MFYFKFAIVFALALTLNACGGGDESATTAAVAPAVTPPPSTVTPVITPSVPGMPLEAVKTCSLPNFQQELMTLINQARATSRQCGNTTFPAAPALVWNSKLFDAAAGHSADMANKNYFSHTSLDGRNFGQRLAAAGYTGSSIAENIAAGQATVADAMQSWISSEGHCRNIMSASYTEVGLACVSSSTASYHTYWTMDLGHP
ncbi:CAP domain-containing protein [Undibacterium sp. Ren11W]|uniref:CAP domain-containing protein n=1 Tax=Undibacterium sp. Ren11W TaxID=3413045 RepID=UPI003BF4075D